MKTMFVRVLDREQVNICVGMLNGISDFVIPEVEEDQETFEIKAPDGDVVFAGLLKDQHYICRLHREVFDERVTLD